MCVGYVGIFVYSKKSSPDSRLVLERAIAGGGKNGP